MVELLKIKFKTQGWKKTNSCNNQNLDKIKAYSTEHPWQPATPGFFSILTTWKKSSKKSWQGS